MTVNKIYLGDAYELIKQLPDNSVDCIYTDVPYLYQKGGVGKSELGARMGNKRTDLKDISDGFNVSIIDEFKRISKKLNLFIWCSEMQMQEIIFKLNNTFKLLVWCKTNPSPTTNNNWLPDLEYCLYFREKGVKVNDGYELKSKWYVSPLNKNDKDLYNHPTIKPLELVKRHLEHATQPNDIVADFFLGSGTTAVAAKELGRRYIGFEIDKDYFKIAKERLNGIDAQGQTSIFTDFNLLGDVKYE